jgi:HSP90 family molecular chaperone
MDLIINYLYSDRDIFLRELISIIAANAFDKERFLLLTELRLTSKSQKLISVQTLMTILFTIEDSGVGMTNDEIMNNLGKIAQSGTRSFAEALGEGTANVNLTGQFGVGFYSASLVADKVTVVTKSMQDASKSYRWESEADSSYTIADASPDKILGASGTKLALHLKDNASAYVEASKIEELLQRYSEFVEFPISIWKETTEYKQVPDEESKNNWRKARSPK